MNDCCNLNIKNNQNDINLNRILIEMKKLKDDTTASLLYQNGKIAELCNYIKDNLSNELRTLIDSMKYSGELDDLISIAINEMYADYQYIKNYSAAYKFYAPSLLNASQSQTFHLAMNDDFAILFDTGTAEESLTNAEWLRNKLGGRKLNAIIVSHFHNDHVGGFSEIIKFLDSKGKVYLPMDFTPFLTASELNVLTPIRNNVISIIKNAKVDYEEIKTDALICFGGLKVQFYNSTPDAYAHYQTIGSGYNAFSMNCMLCLGDTKVYLPFDSVKATQDYLLSVGNVQKVDVYATNHHGHERYNNSTYLSILNPDIEFFSNCPLTWDDVTMLSYDYNYLNKPAQYLTEAFDEIEINVTTHGVQVVKGFYAKENMYINKQYEIYINPEYKGMPKDNVFRSINQALTYLPKEGCNIIIHMYPGTYEKLRFIATNNMIQFRNFDGIAGSVVFKDCQINNANALYFSDIHFTGNVVVNYATAYFSNCTFDSGSTESGNMCVTCNRANVSFMGTWFINCYTGIYAQSGCQVTVKDCTFRCQAYAIYGLCSYIAMESYLIESGTVRADIGCTVKTVDKGATVKRPVFNNSDYMRGYLYFDTTLGKPIFYYNGNGIDEWIDANGNVV